ncbi:MAG: hypothetical protein H6622_03820 [Halobacteriovoraceae bacterium]|nr:hypothetical protein [Halobacteriovoraceae bacterium]
MINQDNTINSTLKSLEDLYLEKKYDALIDNLIEHKNVFYTGHFHYNLGTVYLKKGNYPAARYQFEMALKSNFKRQEVFHNLKFVEESLKKSKGADDLIIHKEIQEVVFDYVESVPFSYYLSLSLFFVVVFLILRKIRINAGLTLKIFFTFLVIFPLGLSYFSTNDLGHAISLKEVSVKEGPSDIYEEIYRMSPGTKIMFNKVKDQWLYISRPSALAGWVKKEDLATF